MVQFNKIKGEDIVPIVFGTILVLIIFALAYLFIQQKDTKTTQPPMPTPTQAAQPQPTTYPNTSVYNGAREKILLDKLKTRAPISDNDRVAKAKILAQLPDGQTSGILYTTAAIQIDYTQAVDEFQVEIFTKDFPQAKSEANIWFRSQGVSQRGICDLPVSFYLDGAVRDSLPKDGSFDPLPNGCE